MVRTDQSIAGCGAIREQKGMIVTKTSYDVKCVLAFARATFGHVHTPRAFKADRWKTEKRDRVGAGDIAWGVELDSPTSKRNLDVPDFFLEVKDCSKNGKLDGAFHFAKNGQRQKSNFVDALFDLVAEGKLSSDEAKMLHRPEVGKKKYENLPSHLQDLMKEFFIPELCVDPKCVWLAVHDCSGANLVIHRREFNAALVWTTSVTAHNPKFILTSEYQQKLLSLKEHIPDYASLQA